MVITLAPDLASALADEARHRGVAPDVLANDVLRQRFLASSIHPRDEWERDLLTAATDCGVSQSNEAVSSEGLYE
jgi:hypothetical protein